MSSAVLMMEHADPAVEQAGYPQPRDALVEVLIALSRETRVLRAQTRELELASAQLRRSAEVFAN